MNSTVLVGDDDPSNVSFFKTVLQEANFSVVVAGDGMAALEAFQRHQPDLVLLNVGITRVNALEVTRRLKVNPGSRLVPIVLVTPLFASEDRVRGLEAGADDFLSTPVNRNEMLARVRSLLSLKQFTDELDSVESVLFTLARSIEGRDPCTVGHCERLSEYSTRLASRMGLPREELDALRRGGVVHDIGKVALPDGVLMKTGPLTPAEFQLIREHPLQGERICAPLRSFRLVLPIIRHHHERLDGSGYPDGLKGSSIPLTARVLTVVDVYDALTTERSYKPALAIGEALQVMDDEVKRGWWDPEVFREFAALLDWYPGDVEAPIRRVFDQARIIARPGE